MNTLEAEARTKLDAVEKRYGEALGQVETRIAALPDSASADEVDGITTEAQSRLDELEAEVRAAKRQVESVSRIAGAREATSRLIPQGDRIEVREAPTYHRLDASMSWFADLYAARKNGDKNALKRLERNNSEFEANVEKRGLAFGNAEQRAAFTSTDFYPPQWMTDLWTSTKRQRRVVAQLCTNLPLPASGNTLELPAYTAPTNAIGSQSADGAAVTSNAGSTSQLSSAVTTVSGYLDVPRQMVERGLPGLDVVIFGDLTRDYNRRIDSLVLYGAGNTGEFQGITLNSGIGAITYSSGTPTASSMTLKFADALQRIQVAVFEGADGIVMHPRRFGSMIGLTDSSGRPLMVVSAQGPYNALAIVNSQEAPFGQSDAEQVEVRPSGWLLGVPVYVDANIATNTGVGTNEDIILVGSFENSVLFEPQAGPTSYTFEGVASANINLRLQIVGYAAFICRYPGAFVKISGTSLIPPVF